jgi:hypothetical protein
MGNIGESPPCAADYQTVFATSATSASFCS